MEEDPLPRLEQHEHTNQIWKKMAAAVSCCGDAVLQDGKKSWLDLLFGRMKLNVAQFW